MFGLIENRTMRATAPSCSRFSNSYWNPTLAITVSKSKIREAKRGHFAKFVIPEAPSNAMSSKPNAIDPPTEWHCSIGKYGGASSATGPMGAASGGGFQAVLRMKFQNHDRFSQTGPRNTGTASNQTKIKS